MFNTTYKIFAKALQRRLQPLLVEVIDSNQVAFLAPRFILDNILLTHESIQWAKESRQDSIFLKLDFSKAYDSVDWTFMLQIMEKLGMPKSINLILLLFYDALVSININNQATQTFRLYRGVHQGCPLAPYLFIILGEALNVVVKNGVGVALLKAFPFLNAIPNKIITSFIVRVEGASVDNRVGIHWNFGLASSLEINWHKSVAY